MKIKNYNKNKNILKKIFIQICRKIGYEIIDQNNLFIPTLEKFANKNISRPGVSSITIPLGKVDITRKIEDITIIVRSYTSTDIDKSKIMLDQNKKRIFDLPKIEYTLRTINSLINSCHEALKTFNNLKIRLIVTDDNSTEVNLQKIKLSIDKAKFDTKIINIDKNEFLDEISKNDEYGKPISEAMISNMRNIYLKKLLMI